MYESPILSDNLSWMPPLPVRRGRMLLREPNTSSLKTQRLSAESAAQCGCLVEELCLRHSSCCSVALTSLILEIITSSLESSYLQASRGNVGALLPMRAAALTRLASLRPEAPGRSGTMVPDEGRLVRAASAGYISFAPARLLLPHWPRGRALLTFLHKLCPEHRP